MAIIVGAIAGIVFKEDATIVKPLGDLFLNLLFIVIVPLIFLTITTSIAKMQQPKRLGKIMRTIILVFVVTSLVAVFVGLATTYSMDLVKTSDGEKIKETLELENTDEEKIELALLDRTVQVISVSDFTSLLSKDNVIALVIFSIMIGIAIRMSKEKGEAFLKVLISANEVIMNFVKIIMYYAPIGIGCYFASFIGTFGSSIAVGYLRTFIIYTIVTVLFYFIVYTIYAYIAAGKKGIKAFWRNALPPTATSIATCSSAACIPVNVEASKKMGVSPDIAETIIPLGTSFHKDGSIIGSVFKIMFLVGLFGTDVYTTSGVFQVIAVALVANLLITAVPIGGGTISEMMILSMMGYPAGALPILTIIATIIDAPATMLNVVGDTSSSMLTARIVDGKNWMDNSLEEVEEKQTEITKPKTTKKTNKKTKK